MRRALYVWLPAVILGACAACIPADMRTGHPHYDAWQSVRGSLLAAAFIYVFLALIGRTISGIDRRLGVEPLDEDDSGRDDRAPGYCRTCGYDLRATPDLCPECGMVPGTSDRKAD